MIEQGTDGLSRGLPYEGLVGQNRDFLHYLPLYLSVFERCVNFITWLKNWLPAWTKFLEPEDWFELGHDIVGWKKAGSLWLPKIRSGFYCWAPPPAAAYKAIEQLRIARHKRQRSSHVFISPRLMTCMWRSSLHKIADLVVEMPSTMPFWPTGMHEPLVIGFVFPAFQHKPWLCMGTPLTERFKLDIKRAFADCLDAIPLLKSIVYTATSSKRLTDEET